MSEIVVSICAHEYFKAKYHFAGTHNLREIKGTNILPIN